MNAILEGDVSQKTQAQWRSPDLTDTLRSKFTAILQLPITEGVATLRALPRSERNLYGAYVVERLHEAIEGEREYRRGHPEPKRSASSGYTIDDDIEHWCCPIHG